MNSNVENIIISEGDALLIDTKSKRASKPKLIAKYDRYLVFGYWFSILMRKQEAIDDVVFTVMLDKLRMYESLENQTALFDLFESELGDTQKIVRKSIADYHKPPRASKKSSIVDSCNGTEVKSKPTKGRKKKATAVVVDNHDDFINQLVAVANASTNPVTASIANANANDIVVTASDNIKEVTQPIQIIETNTLYSTGNSDTKSKPKPKPKKISSIQPVNELLTGTQPIPMVEKKKTSKAIKHAKVEDNTIKVTVVPVVSEDVKEQNGITLENLIVENQNEKGKTTKPKPKPKATKEKKDKVVKANGQPATTVAAKNVNASTILPDVIQKQTHYEEAVEHNISEDQKVQLQEQEQEQEEEEIHAREFILNGQKYLIDENTSDLYDINTQNCIGKFDTATNSIILL